MTAKGHQIAHGAAAASHSGPAPAGSAPAAAITASKDDRKYRVVVGLHFKPVREGQGPLDASGQVYLERDTVVSGKDLHARSLDFDEAGEPLEGGWLLKQGLIEPTEG